MSIFDWLRRLRQREDAHALKRAEETAIETPAERKISEGDIEGMEADLRAAEGMREPSIEDAERLADDE